MSGAWVFKRTCFAGQALFENIEAGATVDQFIEWYEGVRREQVVDVLHHSERSFGV